ncbi:hypothetical protein N8510_00980 [bacterium]|nr:hypothetical protein [bacterium]
MKHFLFALTCSKNDRYEVHVESDCQENARRDVIGSAIERKLWVKNLFLLNLLSDDDYNIEHLEVEDCEFDEQAQDEHEVENEEPDE